MDFLNKALAHLKDLFGSMTIGGRITAALLLVVVVVSLAYLFRYHVSGGDVYLMNGESFSSEQLRLMEGAFAKEGLSGWSYDGPRIRIPRGQQAAFLAALAKNDALPENPGDVLAKAVRDTNVLMDNQQRQQAIKVAKQKELARRIKLMPGIQDAFVLYDTETKRGLNAESVTTASVSVVPIGQPLTPEQVKAIRGTVAYGIAGLKPEMVAVIDLKYNRPWFGSTDAGGPLDNEVAATKRVFEQDWKRKIQELLSNISGAIVTVDVELDTVRLLREREYKPEPKGIPSFVLEKTRTRTQDGAPPGGRAGFVANQPQALPPSQAKAIREEEEETTSQQANIIGTKSIDKETAGLTPKKVTASIGVPTSYFEKVWRLRQGANASADQRPSQTDLDQVRTQELGRIKEAVALLLPKPEGETDPAKFVSVAEFPDIPPEPVPEPGMPETVLGWLAEHWSTLGLIGLALVSLFMLRSMLRAVPPAVESSPLAAAVASAASPEAAAKEAKPEETPIQRRLRRLSGSGPTLRDELSQMVAEDPEAASNILRTWIGNVS
ncbi:MAG: hypothetical protein ACUVUC_08650 [Thermoguttaceae bacterium]